MGSLRADALLSLQDRFIEQRAASIGTLRSSSQQKRRGRGAFAALAGAIFLLTPLARAEEPEGATPAPVSPFTGTTDGPAPALSASPAPRALPPAPTPRVTSRPGAPGNDLPTVPPPPRGAHYHDGLYLRMALGLGFSGSLVSSDAASVPDYSFSGGGAAVDVWLGGTPLPGLALGGGLSVSSAKSTTRRIADESHSGDVSGDAELIGFFIDGFPDPERGFHVGGMVGLASSHTKIKDSSKDDFSGAGGGLGAWLGYDMWVGEQWSLGGMLRFTGTLARDEHDGVKYQTSQGGVALSFTALYH